MSWQSDELLNKARRAEEVGDLWAAHHALRHALAVEPNDISTWIWYGGICNQLEQFAAAVDAFERAIELQPSLPGAYSGLAVALVDTGRLEEAERALLISVKLGPTSSRYVLLADVQTQLDKRANAEASLREAIRLEPNDEEALFDLAVMVRDRDLPEAKHLLLRAVESDPLYAAAYRELAWTYHKEGASTLAEQAINDAIRLDDADPRAHLYLGHLLLERAELSDARREFERAQQLDPFWTVPLLLKGKLLEEQGKVDDAETAFRMAVQLSPWDPDSLAELGRHLLGRNRVDEAARLVNEALRQRPDHSVALEAKRRLPQQ